MSAILSEDQKEELDAQLDAVRRVTCNGSRPLSDVRRALQNIIEAKSVPKAQVYPGQIITPDYYPGPKALLRQLRIWNRQRGWGIGRTAFLMSSIASLSRFEEGELLLPIPRLRGEGLYTEFNFYEAYDLWRVPGSKKHSVPLDREWEEEYRPHLRITPGSGRRMPATSDIEWVLFNPNGDNTHRKEWREIQGDRKRAQSFAGLEVMWAAVLMPEWARSWDGPASEGYPGHTPFIGGLQVLAEGGRWTSEAIGLEYWRNRGDYVGMVDGKERYAGQYGYGFYYVDGRVYTDTPIPTVRLAE